MKKIVLSLLVVSAWCGASLTPLHAGTSSANPPPSHGPASPPYHLTSVNWVLNTQNDLNVDDRYVTLIGHVTKRVGDETYWFTDGTGAIRLDSEDFELPVGPKIVVGGRIDQAYLGFGHIEVDVRHWHFLKK